MLFVSCVAPCAGDRLVAGGRLDGLARSGIRRCGSCVLASVSTDSVISAGRLKHRGRDHLQRLRRFGDDSSTVLKTLDDSIPSSFGRSCPEDCQELLASHDSTTVRATMSRRNSEAGGQPSASPGEVSLRAAARRRFWSLACLRSTSAPADAAAGPPRAPPTPPAFLATSPLALRPSRRISPSRRESFLCA